MQAACAGHLDVIRELLKHSAVVDAQDDSGETALAVAASAGHAECVTALLRAGATAPEAAQRAREAAAKLEEAEAEQEARANAMMAELIKEELEQQVSTASMAQSASRSRKKRRQKKARQAGVPPPDPSAGVVLQHPATTRGGWCGDGAVGGRAGQAGGSRGGPSGGGCVSDHHRGDGRSRGDGARALALLRRREQRAAHLVRARVRQADGFSYERRAIMDWLEAHDTSPVTGATLESSSPTTDCASSSRVVLLRYASAAPSGGTPERSRRDAVAAAGRRCICRPLRLREQRPRRRAARVAARHRRSCTLTLTTTSTCRARRCSRAWRRPPSVGTGSATPRWRRSWRRRSTSPTSSCRPSTPASSRVCGSSAACARCRDAPLAGYTHSLGPRECVYPAGASRLDAALAVELPQTRRRACHRRRPGGGDGV